MPVVAAVAAVAVAAASAAYSAYASDAAGNDRKNAEQQQLDLQKQALAQQGIRTEAELKLANLQIDSAALDVFDKAQRLTTNQTNQQPTAKASVSNNTDLTPFIAFAVVAFVGWKAVKH